MAEIKIRGDVSGSTTIKAPDSGSDEVIELSTELASKLPYSYGTATPSTTDSGFLWYDSNSSPAAPKFWDGAAFQDLGGTGKILQVVRSTYTSNTDTTSSSFVDIGNSITITPQKSTSTIWLIQECVIHHMSGAAESVVVISDSSNNVISSNYAGNLSSTGDHIASHSISAFDTPATTSAVTYKGRFRRNTGSVTVRQRGSIAAVVMYALEISA